MDKSKWEYKKLGEVAKFVGGGTPSKANEDYYTGNIPWATVRDMVNFNLSKTELCITDQAVKESATNIIPKDTIIISTHVGLGKICLLMQDTAINQDLKGVILPQSVDKMFFAAWYKSIADYVISNGKGATVKGVTMKFVNDLNIPIPPINDQQRIVAELDCLNEMIALKQEQLKEFDKLAQSIFYDMFGDPVNNEKHFPLQSIDDVIKFEGGSQPARSFFEYEPTDDNIRLIQIRDYKTDAYITYIPKKMARRFCEEDDIMIGRYGPPIFQILKGLKGAYNVALMKAVPKKGNKEFIRAFLKQDCLLHHLENFSRRVAGQDGIQMDELKAYPFPYPPLALQQQFAEKIQAIEAQKELVKQSIAETQQLLDSRMDYYFD